MPSSSCDQRFMKAGYRPSILSRRHGTRHKRSLPKSYPQPDPPTRLRLSIKQAKLVRSGYLVELMTPGVRRYEQPSSPFTSFCLRRPTPEAGGATLRRGRSKRSSASGRIRNGNGSSLQGPTGPWRWQRLRAVTHAIRTCPLGLPCRELPRLRGIGGGRSWRNHPSLPRSVARPPAPGGGSPTGIGSRPPEPASK